MGEVKKIEASNTYEDMEELKALFPFVLFSLYAIGYTYLKVYYNEFQITFENYINVTDIVFYALSPVLKFVFFYLILEILIFMTFRICSYILIFLFRKPKSRLIFGVEYYLFKKSALPKFDSIVFFLLLIYIFIIFFNFIYPLGFDFSSRLAIFLPAILFKLVLISIRKLEDISGEKMELTSNEKISGLLFLALFVGVTSAYFQAKSNSDDVINGLKKDGIQFVQNEELFSTKDKNIVLIGETSNYIFLYNKSESLSTAFNKSEISKIVFMKDFAKQIF